MWHVVVCDQETSCDEEAIARAGLQSQRKYNIAVNASASMIMSEYTKTLGVNSEEEEEDKDEEKNNRKRK
jgi:hypothetical protein